MRSSSLILFTCLLGAALPAPSARADELSVWDQAFPACRGEAECRNQLAEEASTEIAAGLAGGAMAYTAQKAFASIDEEIIFRRAAELELSLKDRAAAELFRERDLLHTVHESFRRAEKAGPAKDPRDIIPGTQTSYEDYQRRRLELSRRAGELGALERSSLTRAEEMLQDYKKNKVLAPAMAKLARADRSGKLLTGASFLIPAALVAVGAKRLHDALGTNDPGYSAPADATPVKIKAEGAPAESGARP